MVHVEVISAASCKKMKLFPLLPPLCHLKEAWIPPYSVPDHHPSVTSHHFRQNVSHVLNPTVVNVSDCRGLGVHGNQYVGR